MKSIDAFTAKYPVAEEEPEAPTVMGRLDDFFKRWKVTGSALPDESVGGKLGRLVADVEKRLTMSDAERGATHPFTMMREPPATQALSRDAYGGTAPKRPLPPPP